MHIIKTDSAEWHQMWAALKVAEINKDIDDPICAEHQISGEVWQYMHSNPNERTHTFRHRHHPSSNQKELLILPCSPEFQFE